MLGLVASGSMSGAMTSNRRILIMAGVGGGVYVAVLRGSG